MARRPVGILIPAHTQLVLGFLIEGFEIVVSERPIFQVCAGHCAHERPQAKRLRTEAPGKTTVINRAAADHRGQRGVESASWFHHARGVPVTRAHGAHVGMFRTERHTIDAGDPGIACFHVAEGFQPWPPLEQHDPPAGCRQFFGDNAAAGARSDNHGVHGIVFHDLVSRFRSSSNAPSRSRLGYGASRVSKPLAFTLRYARGAVWGGWEATLSSRSRAR